MSNQSLVDDDNQAIDNPEVREVSTHEEEEEIELNESNENNADQAIDNHEVREVSTLEGKKILNLMNQMRIMKIKRLITLK